MTSVVIFGCGPSGLIAAWAAEAAGASVRIISKKRRSELFGAQYLHQQIPGIEAEQREIEYKLIGTADGYRQRIYGANYSGSVSVEELEGCHKAWDIRKTYEFLYSHFEGRIDNVRSGALDATLFSALLGSKHFAQYDCILNTIPRTVICLKPAEHKFDAQRIWALGDAPERGQRVSLSCPQDTVLCNGAGPDSKDGWYRLSNIFGHKTVEWPAWYYPGTKVAPAEVRKPLSTTCDCHSNVVMLGRFGKWKKGVLSHHVYHEVTQYLR